MKNDEDSDEGTCYWAPYTIPSRLTNAIEGREEPQKSWEKLEKQEY